MYRIYSFILIVIGFWYSEIFALPNFFNDSLRTHKIRIGFYNCENFYDFTDDSLTKDDAFLPQGDYHWSKSRFYNKAACLGRVIFNMGGWEPPEIIGLCEVENDFVLHKLIEASPLKHQSYQYVHYDSPYIRGADVALIYRQDKIKLLYSEAISVIFPFDSSSKNRDILYCIFTCFQQDTLHLFVNHWTSRFGGYAATVPKRNYYATLLRTRVDSILAKSPKASIIILGDFNDYPTDQSIVQYLRAGSAISDSGTLINLMFPILKTNQGSHKSKDFWGCLDQIIFSKNLLDSCSSIHISSEKAQIFKADFLLVPDEKYGGTKTYRTYLGPRYIGGYSDHLPVYVDIEKSP